ncbi:MAG: monosaccharide transporter substrate-binding protein family [Pseudonocardiales bacterium]|nr:monosaccharide transporter substrate-binding protein family [Pseudonocardiales bacterium]
MLSASRRIMTCSTTVAASLVAIVLAGGCSSGSASSGSAGSSSPAAAGKADAAVVAQAKRISGLLEQGWVYSADPAPTDPSKIVGYSSWQGSTTNLNPPANVKVEVIVDTFQSAAAKSSADGAVTAGKRLGWSVDEIDGQGSTQGYGQAFDTAFSRNPQAIITIALPTQQIQDRLAKAKQKGIVTIAAVDVPPAAGVTADAYVSFPQSLMQGVLAYEEIARTNGRAKSIVLTDPAYVTTADAMDEYVNVMKTCAGCSVYRGNYLVADSSDAGKVAAVITGALNSHPDATTLDVPFSIGLPAVIQAVKATGRKITVITKDGDTTGIQAVASGGIFAVGGSSMNWAGWASVDQVVRGLTKQPYLPGSSAGLGVAVAFKANAPSNGDIEKVTGMPDYSSEYLKLWGKS